MTETIDFSFKLDDEKMWIATASFPSLARYFRYGFEIATPELANLETYWNRAGNQVDQWERYASAIAKIHGIELEPYHMPPLVRTAFGLPSHQIEFPTDLLAAMHSPFETDAWGVGRITREAVERALASGGHVEIEDFPSTKDEHVNRIAWLIRREDGWSPIIIEEIEEQFALLDGYHRLAAAIYLERDLMKSVVSGRDVTIRARTNGGKSAVFGREAVSNSLFQAS